MADKNITTVNEISSVDDSDKVFVNDGNTLKQITVINLMKKAPASSGGGTTDYNDLTNQPQLNGVTLEGNKTLDQIGAVQKNQGSGNSGKYLSVGSDGNVTLSDAPSGGTVDPEQIKQAVNGYLEENPVQPTPVDATLTKENEAADAKVTGEKLDELNDIASWNDLLVGEIFEEEEDSTEPELPYKTDGLDTYVNFSYFPDGYTDKIWDLSDNNTEINATGLEYSFSGRNGIINGSFLVNDGNLNTTKGGSGISIMSKTVRVYPFTVEMYVHVRKNYNAHQSNGVLLYQDTNAIKTHQGNIFNTQIKQDGSVTKGVALNMNRGIVNISGTALSPNITKNVEGLEIDGIENSNIGDDYIHIVACFDSKHQKFYLNNEKIIDEENGSTYLSASSMITFLKGQLKGDIKIIRIYQGMLTDEEVNMNYLNATGGANSES